ncbi:MAG TPA: hypothetical protein VEZ55_01525 [Chitinophagaceae bacterium]|jgi:hypothetical protein|nr:hypothetical protein [Chitinophagaceae bacterium]
MFIQTWTKYLPILHILLKRAIQSEQTFNLNVSDFQQAGATRKIGYKFTIQFVKGRVDNVLTSNMARDFATAALEHANIKSLLQQHSYQISMNAKFQLSIKCTPQEKSEEELEEEKLVSESLQETTA